MNDFYEKPIKLFGKFIVFNIKEELL